MPNELVPAELLAQADTCIMHPAHNLHALIIFVHKKFKTM